MSVTQTKAPPTKEECYRRFHEILAVGYRRHLERKAAEARHKETTAATAAS